jgi:hypothetical protein
VPACAGLVELCPVRDSVKTTPQLSGPHVSETRAGARVKNERRVADSWAPCGSDSKGVAGWSSWAARGGGFNGPSQVRAQKVFFLSVSFIFFPKSKTSIQI